MTSAIFERIESNVRSYCRSHPTVFSRAAGSILVDEAGREFIDFFAGAGSLNFGHNPRAIMRPILDYCESNGIVQGLDLHTTAKRRFLERFEAVVLRPRGLDYKIQFTGPTGTNAVEAALKLARKVTGRAGIFAFMGGFHGMTLGSLRVSSRRAARGHLGGAGDVTFLPFPDSGRYPHDTIAFMDAILRDDHSGIDRPAAVIIECVQADGGVYVAPAEWLQRLRALCSEHDVLLICDEVQAGVHRTGPFFSFERASIEPDLVTLSKSLSGCGLPMSLVLMRRHLDLWEPGEHTGTFRGNQLAFVGATAALEFAVVHGIAERVAELERIVRDFLQREIASLADEIEVRGAGMLFGIDLARLRLPGAGGEVVARCFASGLVLESAGRGDSVVKIMPPLTIDEDLLMRGCRIVRDAVADLLTEGLHAGVAGHA